MRYLFLLCCISLYCFASAQNKLKYAGSVEGGLVIGNKQTKSYVLTTQGIALKQYTIGLGSGFDFYALHSVPLFAEAKKRFGSKAIQSFVQAAGGVNFTGSKSSNAKYLYQYANGRFMPGCFLKGGGGIIFNAQKRLKLSLSAGYTFKSAVYKYEPFTGTPWLWQTVPNKDVYRFNRWYAGIGIMW